MLLDLPRAEAARNSLLLTELEKFIRRQSAEVQASLLAFVHLLEPSAGVSVTFDVTESGEMSLALLARQDQSFACLDT